MRSQTDCQQEVTVINISYGNKGTMTNEYGQVLSHDHPYVKLEEELRPSSLQSIVLAYLSVNELEFEC